MIIFPSSSAGIEDFCVSLTLLVVVVSCVDSSGSSPSVNLIGSFSSNFSCTSFASTGLPLASKPLFSPWPGGLSYRYVAYASDKLGSGFLLPFGPCCPSKL